MSARFGYRVARGPRLRARAPMGSRGRSLRLGFGEHRHRLNMVGETVPGPTAARGQGLGHWHGRSSAEISMPEARLYGAVWDRARLLSTGSASNTGGQDEGCLAAVSRQRAQHGLEAALHERRHPPGVATGYRRCRRVAGRGPRRRDLHRLRRGPPDGREPRRDRALAEDLRQSDHRLPRGGRGRLHLLHHQSTNRLPARRRPCGGGFPLPQHSDEGQS